MVFFFGFFFESLSKWMTGSSHKMQLPQILIIDSQPKKEKKKEKKKNLNHLHMWTEI